MVCLILLAIQLVRVSFLQNTKDQKPSLAETLISDEKDVICEGTVYRIENKSQSTAIYLKDAVVSCTDQKSKNQIIKEKKILVTIKNNKSGKKIRMKIHHSEILVTEYDLDEIYSRYKKAVKGHSEKYRKTKTKYNSIYL